jgi:hypothetical protein
LSAAAVIKEAAEHGVKLWLDGNNVKIAATAKPSEYLLKKLRIHKAEIAELLRNQVSDVDTRAPLSLQGVTEFDAAEAKYQRQLARLREENARVYANRTSWKVK